MSVTKVKTVSMDSVSVLRHLLIAAIEQGVPPVISVKIRVIHLDSVPTLLLLLLSLIPKIHFPYW